MQCGPGSTDRINSFALVSYVPGRLGDFMTQLREELVMGCVARSHVTVLPPRPVCVEPQVAEAQIRAGLSRFEPFTIELGKIRTFQNTAVVFVEVCSGREQLVAMHDYFNQDGLAFAEPYPFHPHITLAQGFPPEQVRDIYDMALRRWQEALPAREFLVDSLTFVQNTVGNRWLDLADCTLGKESVLAAR
jgi:2'-5' RNA ligase